MTKMLCIEKNPPINTYLHYAFPFSILMTDDYYNDWILNNFIQLVFDPHNRCSFDYHEIIYTKWPCIKARTLYKTDISRHDNNIIEYVIRELKDDYYVIAWIDMYYIPGHPYYKKKHRQHGILLYGFDTENKNFYSMIYGTGNKYRDQKISFAEFDQAYNGMLPEDEIVYLEFVQINKNECVDYDFYKIQYKLKCYLNSKRYDIDDYKYHSAIKITHYGVDACKYLISQMKELAETKKNLDLRYPYLFAEHKRCMIFRIKKILEEYNIPNYPFSNNEFEKALHNIECIVPLSIKYQCTKKTNLMHQLCTLMTDTLLHEELLLNPIINYNRNPTTVLPRKDGKPRYIPLDLL